MEEVTATESSSIGKTSLIKSSVNVKSGGTSRTSLGWKKLTIKPFCRDAKGRDRAMNLEITPF